MPTQNILSSQNQSSTPILLALKDVTKIYRLGETDVSALRGVSLDVAKGEFTAITGPSGSGKSTLLNIIGCIDRVTTGSYQFSGKEVGQTDFDDLAPLRARSIGFIFQAFNLVPVLNVLENIEFPCQFHPEMVPAAQLRERARTLAEDVGLGAVMLHRPDQLSGGQRQRVAIARALIASPTLVLADEPTANLDAKTSEQIIDLMLRLNAEKHVTFLFSTHDARIEKHARRIVRISDGQIQAS